MSCPCCNGTVVGALLAKQIEVSALKKEIREAKERAVNAAFRIKSDINALVERQFEEMEASANVVKERIRLEEDVRRIRTSIIERGHYEALGEYDAKKEDLLASRTLDKNSG